MIRLGTYYNKALTNPFIQFDIDGSGFIPLCFLYKLSNSAELSFNADSTPNLEVNRKAIVDTINHMQNSLSAGFLGVPVAREIITRNRTPAIERILSWITNNVAIKLDTANNTPYILGCNSVFTADYKPLMQFCINVEDVVDTIVMWQSHNFLDLSIVRKKAVCLIDYAITNKRNFPLLHKIYTKVLLGTAQESNFPIHIVNLKKYYKYTDRIKEEGLSIKRRLSNISQNLQENESLFKELEELCH